MEKKKVINLFGCPSAGKSRNSARLFADMKDNGYDVELVPEYAKELTWANRKECLKNQVAVFGRQYEMLCIPKTEYRITDSPLLLCLLYNDSHGKELNDLALRCYNEFHNINFFLKLKKYIPKGRNQTEEEARELEQKLISILKLNGIPYLELEEFSFENIKKFL